MSTKFPQPQSGELEADPIYWLSFNPYMWKIVQGKIGEIANKHLWENYTNEIADAIEDILVPHELPGGTMAFSGLKVHSNVNQSIPNDATTALNWQVEQFDHQNAIAVPGNFIEVPENGYCRITASAAFNVNLTGWRQLSLTRGGLHLAAVRLAPSSNVQPTIMQVSFLGHLAAGDNIVVNVRHTAGAALDVIVGDYQTWCAVQWLGE